MLRMELVCIKGKSQDVRGAVTELSCWRAAAAFHRRNVKIPTHQVLSVQLTTHRLLFICTSTATLPPDTSNPMPVHLQVHLADIRQTEHYTGFLRSSSKITLQLGIPTNSDGTPDVAGSISSINGTINGVASRHRPSNWTCRVCGFHNEVASSTAADGQSFSHAHWSSAPGAAKCKLCGIARPEDSEAELGPAIPSTTSLNPTTASATKQIPCPRCTYLNDARLAHCEMCGAKIGTAPLLAPVDPPPTETIRISFRRGGDKEVYRRLKTVLASRTWEGKAGRMGAVRLGGTEDRAASEGTSRTGTPTRGIGIGK